MTELNNENAELSDEEFLNEEGNEQKYEKHKLLYDPEKINIITREPTIEQLLRRINEEALNLAPDFQRHANVWKDDAKSRLIESIMIRIPLPAFYIDGTNEKKWLVVDGIQRLFALKQFVMDKALKLSGLEYLTNLEGKTYDELEPIYKRRILETQPTVYLIEKGTPFEVKYNIFKRINTGGEPLSPQELRHALNPGKATQFLADMAGSKEFQQAVNLSDPRKMRMEDREFILGFLAFYITHYKDYRNNNRDTFLSETLTKANEFPPEKLECIGSIFKKTMTVAWEIFGEVAFRKISKKQKKRYPLNKALFEAWSVNISWLTDEKIYILKIKKEELIDTFIKYVDNDKEFLASISQAGSKVEYRFSTIEKIIQQVLQ